jgi:hypothetical protein
MCVAVVCAKAEVDKHSSEPWSHNRPKQNAECRRCWQRLCAASNAPARPQMKLELLRGGPGVVSFVVYDDFQAYSSGAV